MNRAKTIYLYRNYFEWIEMNYGESQAKTEKSLYLTDTVLRPIVPIG